MTAIIKFDIQFDFSSCVKFAAITEIGKKEKRKFWGTWIFEINAIIILLKKINRIIINNGLDGLFFKIVSLIIFIAEQPAKVKKTKNENFNWKLENDKKSKLNFKSLNAISGAETLNIMLNNRLIKSTLDIPKINTIKCLKRSVLHNKIVAKKGII